MTDFEVSQITDEELMAFLEKKEAADERRREYAKAHPDKQAWNRVKARMATDPDFAEKVRQQRKQYTAARQERERERMANDPAYAEKVRAQRNEATRARNAKQKALIEEARRRGFID